MLLQQVAVLRDIPRIEIIDPKIEEYVEQHAQTEQREVHAVLLRPHSLLHFRIYTEYIERLDQQVQKEEKSEIDKEFTLHNNKVSAKCNGVSVTMLSPTYFSGRWVSVCELP